jgi:CHASE1-domain containing sensor protein
MDSSKWYIAWGKTYSLADKYWKLFGAVIVVIVVAIQLIVNGTVIAWKNTQIEKLQSNLEDERLSHKKALERRIRSYLNSGRGCLNCKEQTMLCQH